MMVWLLALLIGVLFGSGVYLLLGRRASSVLLGLALISHAVNLVVFSGGGLVTGVPPLVPTGTKAPPAGSADPIPQALVLTAIVIGFAVVALAAAVVRRNHVETGSDATEPES
jgi:multicomponent Na+:H+ antiporter subunit C